MAFNHLDALLSVRAAVTLRPDPNAAAERIVITANRQADGAGKSAPNLDARARLVSSTAFLPIEDAFTSVYRMRNILYSRTAYS